jgi:arginyl-tRNA synthetase
MQEKITHIVKEVLKNLGIEEVDFVVEHPEDLKNGDYSTNVAMVCAKNLKTNPKQLAEKIVEEINKNLPQKIEKIEVAGAGFINFYLSREFFAESVEKIVGEADNFGKNNYLEGKKIMIDYTQPNPFKPFHIGHLMTNAIGESIATILEHSGADVSRANYQGDVGLHVAKAFYGMQKKGMPQDMSASVQVLAEYIGDSYVLGSKAYEDDNATQSPSAQGYGGARKEIDILNKKIYDRSDPEVNEVYDWGFKITMEAFEGLYKILGTKFDFYFLESNMTDIGLEIVEANIGKIFEKSDGAIVFKAEKYDPKLHTRVFITSAGLPTYETKELGLTEEKFKTVPGLDLSIVVTATEQAEYMKVVTKAISLINPEHASKMKHVTNGMMRLASGKMSSRKGNVITGESLIRDTIALVGEKMKENNWDEAEKNKISEAVGVAAIKYSILRSKLGGDIVYNVDESVSVEGDSGPYLQYSFARANSIIEKAEKENILPDFEILPEETFEVEKMLYKFGEVVLRSAQEYEPHYIANYLIEVARSFNSFYGNNLIIDKKDKISSYKVALTFAFSFVMKTGLHLLGIKAPEKM